VIDNPADFWYNESDMRTIGKTRFEKAARNIAVALLIVFAFPASVNLALANAWWGKGARDLDWVLKHGGTVIRCEINDISGNSSEYKAVMYRDDGHYVEKEFGTKMTFDDAIDGKYKISAYRGGTVDRTTYKGGKKFSSITFRAHPGEAIKIKFNYKKKSAKMTTDYDESKEESEEKSKSEPKLIAQTLPKPELEPKPEVEPQPETDVQEPAPVKESIVEAVEEIVHPDAVAAEFKKLEMPDTDRQMADFFRNAWSSVVHFFKFDWMRPQNQL